jgi:hypothetical protein
LCINTKISSKKILKLTKDITPPKQNIQDFRIFFTKNIQQKNPKTNKRFNPSQTKHTRFQIFFTEKNPAKKILKRTKDLTPPKQNTQDFRFFSQKKS